jgi:S-formylglutathione hydrolase
MRLPVVCACMLLPVLASPSRAQTPPPPGAGVVIRETVHSPSLEGNLLGDPADQPVAIYLPPGYEDGVRRYPVLYLLHGIGGSQEDWLNGGYQGLSIAALVDSLLAAGAIQPMIVVMPNGTNRYIGTYYTNSPVSGGWEDWIARDLVAYVDGAYRTLPRAGSRGIAGHSMGGMGAFGIAMHQPGIFSAVWAMNPCCLAMVADIEDDDAAWERASSIRTLADFDAALEGRDFYPVAIVALAAAFSPRPDLPPLYVELPFRVADGEVVPSGPPHAKWLASFPVAQARAHRDALEGLRALRFDTVFDDEFAHIPPSSRMLADTLAELGVPHVFEMYEGDHRSRMRERMTTLVLPFFSEILTGED